MTLIEERKIQFLLNLQTKWLFCTLCLNDKSKESSSVKPTNKKEVLAIADANERADEGSRCGVRNAKQGSRTSASI